MAHPSDDDIGAATNALHDLGRLSGWVAHEINNPLGGIQNAFALIQGAVPADHPHHKYVAAIEREIGRIAAFTGRLHHTYTYEAPLTVDTVAHAVADAARALEQLRHARQVSIDPVIDAATASIVIPGHLGRGAVRHLLQHALELAPPGSTVVLRAWRADSLLWLAVPNPARRAGPGRGLVAGPPGFALLLVHRLVKELAGQVAVSSDSDGLGEIRIGVPISTARAEDA